jgi:hypothetical protein
VHEKSGEAPVAVTFSEMEEMTRELGKLCDRLSDPTAMRDSIESAEVVD